MEFLKFSVGIGEERWCDGLGCSTGEDLSRGKGELSKGRLAGSSLPSK